MRTVLRLVGVLVGIVLLLAVGVYLWASGATDRALAATYEAHSVDFPIPFPLSGEETAALGLDGEGARLAAGERAIERGRHLVSARYACTECHGANFAGGVMVDAFPIGTLLGPNLTAGEGSRTAGYTAADWDRTVRHGILPDGRPSVMPSEDFQQMSDQELADVIAFIRAQPAVDNAVPPPSFGPLGLILIATGEFPLPVTRIATHDAPHPRSPPETAPTPEFGAHLAATCTGCHGENLAGGPIIGGDPSWPPARNLTSHASGLGAWSYEDFVAAMREGVRPDGTQLLPPMTLIFPYAQQMTDVEMQAMWAHLRSLPAVETGNGVE
jgi:cytochrome c553